MKVFLISDTHFNHDNIKTYCDRPDDFTSRLVWNWGRRVQPADIIIHLGDVFMHKAEGWRQIWPLLTGRKILVRGNHDRKRSCSWWMDNGFDFACDGLSFRNAWLSHEPAESKPSWADLNIHGHLHNVWHGFGAGEGEDQMRAVKTLRYAWQRLFAVEYTNYCPVEFDDFVMHPDRYQARGPKSS